MRLGRTSIFWNCLRTRLESVSPAEMRHRAGARQSYEAGEGAEAQGKSGVAGKLGLNIGAAQTVS
jgi:hypothetical protein